MIGRGGKRILLVGAGHAHLHLLANAGQFAERGHTVTVLAPENFWYSGLATGMVGGFYGPDDDQVDIAALARRCGAGFIRDAVTGFDTAAKTVTLRGGRSLPYDALSLNLGSLPPEIPGGDAPGCYAVKPISGLFSMREDLLSRFSPAGSPVRVVVAGGGATGAELAANIDALARRSAAPLDLSLVSGRGAFLAQLPKGAARAVEAALARRGVAIMRGSRVARIADGAAELDSGDRLPFDIFLNAAGLRPSPLIAETGLPLDAAGALRIDAHLHSVADPCVHAAGDCAALEGYRLPRIGVYAIRQAPILLANLLAAAEGGKPKAFSPQSHYLWILNMGDGSGVAMRGSLWWHGRSAFQLKDWIDRRFMDTYRQA